MELRQIRSLVLLADLGNLKRIAEKVHLSSPSVYRQLKTLEEQLGTPLYERAGNGLRLTEAARVMLPELRGTLARCESALAALDEWKGVKRGCVRIGAGPIASTYLLPRVLKRFLSRYPGASASLFTGGAETLIQNLNAGAIDLAFVAYHERYEPPQLAVDLLEEVCDIEMVLVTRKATLPHGRPLRQLKHEPFVLYKEDIPLNHWIELYLAEANLRPRVIIRCDRSETIKAMVQAGVGIAMLPLWAVASEVKERKLHLIRQRERPLLLKMSVARPDTPHTPPAVRAFLDIVRALERN